MVSGRIPVMVELQGMSGLIGSKLLGSFESVVEYLLPAATLLILLSVDLKLVSDLNIYNRIESWWLQGAFLAVVLAIVGWLMYVTRYYQLFPGFKARKIRFRETIVDQFDEFKSVHGLVREKLGKYIFRRFWKAYPEETRNETLKLHVTWVFLTHLANNILISFVVVIGLWIYQASEEKDQSLGLLLVLAVVHVTFFFWVRRAALKSLETCNIFVFNAMRRDLERMRDDLKELAGSYPENVISFVESQL